MPISVKTPPDLTALAPALRSVVTAALRAERRPVGEIGVVLAGDVLLRELNRDYRGLDKATDVLSFGYDEAGEGLPKGAPRPAHLPVNGDLLISMDRVREQAKRFRVTEAHELARLVVHGALHLSGLDHREEGERKAMRAREEAVLADAKPAIESLAMALRNRAGGAPAKSAAPAKARKKAVPRKSAARKPAARRTASRRAK